MSTPVVRLLFAALCGVFFFAISGVASWEWLRFRRGESALSSRHFRFRMLSALTWMLVLGAFFVLTVWLWPDSSLPPKSPLQQAAILRASRVFIGAFTLMLLAFALMTLDMFWTVQIGRRNALKRSRQTQDALQRELDKRKNGGANGTS